MRQNICAIVLSILVSISVAKISYAAEELSNDHVINSNAEQKSCSDKVLVKVNGLVCDFCARALEKTFKKREEVSTIHVDLDKGEVGVSMFPGQTIEDPILEKLIKDSGYNVVSINKGC